MPNSSVVEFQSRALPRALRARRLRLAAAIALAASLLASTGAQAQSARNPARQTVDEFERPTGIAFGAEEAPYDASTRDLAGNRLIIDGIIVPNGDPSSLPVPLDRALGVNTGFANSSLFTSTGTVAGTAASRQSGAAIGNQINVTTNGSNNTVIVNARQTNTGAQTVILNGSLNLGN